MYQDNQTTTTGCIVATKNCQLCNAFLWLLH